MALIKCPECGREVSSNAAVCPNCGTPIKVDTSIRVQFPKTGTILPCYVYNENGDTLAKCNTGEVASFRSSEPLQIVVKMSGFFGKAKIEAHPGGRYSVSTKLWGNIGISEVDQIASSGDNTGGWEA